MTKKAICLAQRVVVIVCYVLLSQSFHYSQTVDNETLPAVVMLRLSFELKKPRQFTFSPASKLLAVQREDGSVQIIDITDGHEQAVLPLADKALYGMEWTSDGLRLLIVTAKSAALWDARVGTRLSTPIQIPRDKYFMLYERVKLSPDEKLLLNVKQDDSIKALVLDREKAIAQVWSVESGQLKFEVKIKGTSGRAEFSPNSKQILTTSEKEDAKLWDLETGRLFASLKPPQRAVFRDGSYAEFSPDARFVIQTHEQGIHIWNSATGVLKTRIPFNRDSTDNLLNGFTPDGKMFATVQQTRGWHALTSIELRDCETGELRLTLTARKWEDWPNQMLWSNDGRTFIAASGHKYNARIWEVETGRLKAMVPLVLTYSRIPFDFGYKDRDQLTIHPTLPVISAASNKSVRLWSTETGELLQALDQTGGPGGWSADGKLFLTSTTDLKTVHVWDVVTFPDPRGKLMPTAK